MAAEHHPDLSAYPLLRLDELQLIDLHTLEQSQRDLRALIAQEDARSVLTYLQKPNVGYVNISVTKPQPSCFCPCQ
jgi:hypothetical protein